MGAIVVVVTMTSESVGFIVTSLLALIGNFISKLWTVTVVRRPTFTNERNMTTVPSRWWSKFLGEGHSVLLLL